MAYSSNAPRVTLCDTRPSGKAPRHHSAAPTSCLTRPLLCSTPLVMAKPSLRQLDLFAQMVAAGDIARCASDLGIGADEIAHEIAALEMRLGYRLFDDLHGAARLTQAGHKTAQAMTLLGQERPEPAVAPAAPAAEQAPPPPPPPPPPAEATRRPITLGAPPPVFGHFQEALAAFEEANEDVAIALDLHIVLAAQAREALERGEVDIAYFYALGETEGLPSRYGWSEPLSLYAGTAHPLATQEVVSFREVQAAPMLAMEPRNGLRQISEEALRRGGVTPVPPALESDNLFEIMAALRQGAGWFAAFGPMARDMGRVEGIRRLALETPLPAIEIRQAISPRAVEVPAVEALADYLFM
ncbi:DNA-binding transcriptional regulator, LysR family [Sphingobium faniae]|nr:DNA-binding transcriptional regulator, LysR family [Sphingobium faniae]